MPLSVLPIHSQMPADLQAESPRAHLGRAAQGHRRDQHHQDVLTVDDILYVVDGGYSKVGMVGLQSTPISHANANQLTRRTGLAGSSRCYRLRTERALMPFSASRPCWRLNS
ncbi:hypothetical protein CALVIDRAFT_601113 [Calocera viscosa TUFC12733]|uniref:Uncharacterized protein n=1 Tax=Calocera viscosa (strain TUFC12733) TaxID=1330018 RepID=A0A167IVW9_CALVF|nr:hypothetical protein CALVIDRAFT_601113 [Calocera viscosa TUFC12733]